MRIVEITGFPVTVPVPPEQQVRLGIGTMVKRDMVFVKVKTESGLVGWGESHHGRAHLAIATLVNTTLTATYLLLILPIAGVHLPLTKTLVLITFVAGLLPVLGNLISNTVIVVISLGVSPEIAAASLTFLVLVHKLEYFLNAHIIGSSVNASIWEMLLAMITLESLFGLPGLVAAPVLYAYLKQELLAARLVGAAGPENDA